MNWQEHPHAKTKTVDEIEEEIFIASIDHGALVMRGSWFYAENDIPHDTMFFRATYAAAPFEKIQEAIKRFGDAVRESFGITAAENGSAQALDNGKHAIELNGDDTSIDHGNNRTKVSE